MSDLNNDVNQEGKHIEDQEKKIAKPQVKKHRSQKKSIFNSTTVIIVLLAIIVVGGAAVLGPKVLGDKEPEREIITTATLERIINISELSTFQAVYNGIAEVMNEDKPEDIDCYVSYEARVYAGFDLEGLVVNADDEEKKVIITIPGIELTEVNVDITSLEYMYVNDKADESAITARAYPVCLEDVTNESKEEEAIYELAEQSAKNIVEALVNPFIEQLDSEYELEIIQGGM